LRVIVNIDVPDLAPAIAFYTAALGLRHNRTLNGDVAKLVGASSVIYLLQNAPGSSPGAHVRRPLRPRVVPDRVGRRELRSLTRRHPAGASRHGSMGLSRMRQQGDPSMVVKPVPGAGPSQESRLQEAMDRMKSVTDRQAAVIAVLSRVGVSAQDKRLAQAENKKLDRDLREAKRLLEEAQAAARK
jgi:catechol 2,3-dioxygenase-like lactoylglutathione lyase family enzyme